MPNRSSPLVSIITPVLNSASTVELTLASVAAQTYPKIEHIVVDGESTDGTIDILRGFRSVVPLHWLSEPDAGMYAAINKGVRMARGEILAYLNADDLYLPWSVEQAVTTLISSGDDLVFGDVIVMVKRGGLGRSATVQFYPAFRTRIYMYEVRMGQPSVFWHRRVSDRVGGFDEQMRYSGDFEYWLRTGTAGFRYTHVREVLAVQVNHEGTLTTIHSDELRREIDQSRARYAEIVRPRRFLRLRALTRSIYWRRQVLMLRLNLRRNHPSSWPNLVRFLRRADVKLGGSTIISLLLPLPLPKSWSMWDLDAAEFELKLIAELRSRCSGG